MSLKIIDLGNVSVDFGLKDDPERVRNLVGNFRCHIPLSNEWFPRHIEWLEGVHEQKLGIAWFKYEEIFSFSHGRRRLKEEGLDKLTTICHLTAIIPMLDDLWAMIQCGECPKEIFTSDPSSCFWERLRGKFVANAPPGLFLFRHDRFIKARSEDYYVDFDIGYLIQL